MQYKDCLKGILFVTGLLAVTVVHAHTPAQEGVSLLAGLLHPLSGWDHLLALLAVGLWAPSQGAAQLWRLPLLFVGVMLAGVFLGRTGLLLPMVEAGIASSLLVLGLLLVFMIRLPAWISMAMIAVFAVFHGYAHGVEIPQQASALVYGLGFSLAAAALLATATGLGRYLTANAAVNLLRAGGLAVGTTGVLMMV